MEWFEKTIRKGRSQLSEKIGQLKLKSTDGKFYNTDVLDTKAVLRLIESVPSPKAEPFKLWLANLGSERIDEVFDPEIAVNRAVEYYRNKGAKDLYEKETKKSAISKSNSLNYKYIDEQKQIEQGKKK